jgi:hypothetical protein
LWSYWAPPGTRSLRAAERVQHLPPVAMTADPPAFAHDESSGPAPPRGHRPAGFLRCHCFADQTTGLLPSGTERRIDRRRKPGEQACIIRGHVRQSANRTPNSPGSQRPGSLEKHLRGAGGVVSSRTGLASLPGYCRGTTIRLLVPRRCTSLLRLPACEEK